MYEDDKLLYQARRRDRIRAKLRPAKRELAQIQADRIVDEHIRLKKKDTEMNDRNANRAVYDDAMESAMSSLREQGNINNKIVL